MPSVSPEQERFFGVVHAIQSGKMNPSKAHGKAKQAARDMDPGDVKDFLMECFALKACPAATKKRIAETLKRIQETYDDSNPSVNVVASSKRFHGDFKETIKGYRGYMLTPHENQAATNGDIKPTIHNNFNIGFSKSDPVGNTSTILIKKLREPDGQYVYTAIVKVRGGEDQEEQPAPQEAPPAGGPPEGGAPPQKGALTEGAAGDEIKIIKSIPISVDSESDDPTDAISGDEILTNFINAIYHTYA